MIYRLPVSMTLSSNPYFPFTFTGVNMTAPLPYAATPTADPFGAVGFAVGVMV
jgi:hypothetical protein